MVRLSSLLAVAFVAGVFQNPPPSTDIYLATLSANGAKVTIGQPTNISNNPGYDNQPSFTPDGQAILFTSVRGERKPDPANSAQTGSDIYRYDLASGQVSQVTATAESEYSPTITPDGKHISVVRVEGDGTQRLWKFALDGSRPEVVLPDLKPVGYHAWADTDVVALFVLGTPATLHLADTRSGTTHAVAKDVGRSIQKNPRGGISFVQRQSQEGTTTVTVMQLDPKTRQSSVLVRAVGGARDPDLAWTPDGTLLTASAGKLFGWRRGDAAFAVMGDLAALGLRGVTRIAVSPKGDRIALVAQQR